MSITKKFTASIISILLVAALCSVFFFYKIEYKEETKKMELSGRMAGQVIEESLTNFMLSRDSSALNEKISALKESTESIRKIWLINSEGVIKGGTDSSVIEKKLTYADYDCRGCHDRRQNGAFLEGKKTFRWVQPVRNKPSCHRCHNPKAAYNGIILLDFSLDEVDKHVRKGITAGASIIFVTIAIIGLCMLLLSELIINRRLDGVMEKVKGFKEGNYSIRIPVEGDDEISRLEEEFNDMADAILARDLDRKQWETALQEQLQFLQLLIDTIPMPVFYKDVRGAYQGCNKAFESFLGLARDGIIGKTVYDVAPRELADKYYGMDRELYLNPGVQAYDFAVRHADGAMRDVIFTKATYTGTDGTVAGLIGVMIDISERKKAEEEREELIRELKITFAQVSRSQKIWQETFDSMEDLISIHDTDFNLIKVNWAFARYFGLHPREVINKKCYDLFHLGGSPSVNCPQVATMREGRTVTAEISDPKTNRIFLISTSPCRFPDAEFSGVIHVAKDITDERDKEMRLIMSERLASLGQMASGIAHELNNPLAAILGCAEGLLSRVRRGQFDPQLFAKYLEIIEEEISRCKNITFSMLSFVRKTTYEKREMDINDSVDKTLEIIGYQGRLKEVEVIKKYGDLPVLRGNEGELRQVFMAIITNALDAIEDRGALNLETGYAEKEVYIMIGDTGPGIPPEQIGRIFDPFFTTKAERGGTGLGLSIANRIVANHDGRIDVIAEKAKGTVFKITLPV